MGLRVSNMGGNSRGGGVTKLNYTFDAPGGNMVIPGNSLIAWMVSFDASAFDNIVTMGTAPGGNDFFDDTVLPNIPYEVNKGLRFQNATTIYVTCSQRLSVTLYKL